MNVFSGAKDRVVTGIALLVAVLFIGIIDNFFVMYVVLGVIYLLAFKEALRLFEIQNASLIFYAAALWIIAGIYPYGDDIFVLAGVSYASAIAYNKNLEWKNFLPFIYPTA